MGAFFMQNRFYGNFKIRALKVFKMQLWFSVLLNVSTPKSPKLPFRGFKGKTTYQSRLIDETDQRSFADFFQQNSFAIFVFLTNSKLYEKDFNYFPNCGIICL